MRAEFPKVQAVNAMYTHGLTVIISTKKRYGGFAKAVGMSAMTTPHGLGYVTQVIVVDMELAPAASPVGITSKMITDATTPVSPDNRGNFSTPVRDLPEAKEWTKRLQSLIAAR